MDDPVHTIRVPASTSNVGAGFDCVGIALELHLTVHLTAGRGPAVYRGALAGLDPQQDLMAKWLGAAGVLDAYRLHATSDIPLSRGLGSSAAAVVAATALVQAVETGSLDRNAIFRSATRAEGHPDNAAPATFGGAILAVAGADQPIVQLEVHPSLGLALAVPELVLETQAARQRLPDRYPRETAVAQASRVGALVLGLQRASADLLCAGLDDQLAAPYRTDLIPGYAGALTAAVSAGAHGATISGAGSTLIAVAPHARTTAVAAAMVEALTAAGNPATPHTPNIDQSGVVLSG